MKKKLTQKQKDKIDKILELSDWARILKVVSKNYHHNIGKLRTKEEIDEIYQELFNLKKKIKKLDSTNKRSKKNDSWDQNQWINYRRFSEF